MRSVGTPGTILPGLFEAVQRARILDDSKTFADAIPRRPPADILQSFESARGRAGFDLAAFVAAQFDFHAPPPLAPAGTAPRPVRAYIENAWDILIRDDRKAAPDMSLLPLPHPYIVPGGRFREMYYWDSYFTMLGLTASGRGAMMEGMVRNCAYLIDTLGFVPNANRSYFCSRSQPPLFAFMVELLAGHHRNDDPYREHFASLEREYRFWMNGADRVHAPGEAVERVVSTGAGRLNRYWDALEAPRPESFAEDEQLAAGADRTPAALYRDLRAACESGWDFSSRWLADPASLASIRTTAIVPVDLNAAMYKLESVLAHAAALVGREECAAHYRARADERRAALSTLFFDADQGVFCDLALPGLAPTGRVSLAAAMPLFAGAATDAQAKQVAGRLRDQFLKPGGWVTTLLHTDQQWDAPNGWAPLQWIVYAGLNRYGFTADAADGARRWVDNVLAGYRHSGRLLEKYDVESPGTPGRGGEYIVQDGFGWTNGVLLGFMNALEYA